MDKRTDLERVTKRLSYKLPVTLRYGFAIGVFVGLPLCIFRQKPSLLIKSMLYTTIVFGFGTCLGDFKEYITLKYAKI